MDHSIESAEHDRMTVVDVAGRRRYELILDDRVVGFADYRLDGSTLAIPHVETAHEHRGKGFAGHLLDEIVRDARDRDLTLVPICAYAVAYLRASPDALDVLS